MATTQEWAKKLEELTFSYMGSDWVIRKYGSVGAWRASTDYANVMRGLETEGEAFYVRHVAAVQEAATADPTSRYNTQGGQLVPSTASTADVILRDLFSSYGVAPTLGDWAYNQLLEGRSVEEILVLAQERDEWKTRFVGNEARKKAGLPVLSPAEYLAVETQYKQIYRAYGLPEGMYDDPTDFATLIGYGVSANELQGRLDLGTQRVQNAPVEVREALRTYYGISDQTLLGYVLDPKRGLAEIERKLRQAEIMGAADMSGINLGITSPRGRNLVNPLVRRLEQQGVGFEEARQGFSQVALEQESQLSGPITAGPDLNTEQLINAVLLGDPQAISAIQRRRSQALSGADRGGGPATTQRGVVGLG